ncbi:DinB family protein [Paenibacillus sp. 1P03SA]|uniref:DinB family protein n=1 Tax=Paenibacillus sp. 1P03SA TaxID=3132294 RepID=UPI0039A3BD89
MTSDTHNQELEKTAVLSGYAEQQYDYHVWANEKVFAGLKALPEELSFEQIQSIFPSVADALNHIYMMDEMWLVIMKGGGFEEARKVVTDLYAQGRGDSLDELQKKFALAMEKYRAFFAEGEGAAAETAPSHPQFGSLETHVYALVQHVVNHGTYHRGNISAMLRQFGHKGTPTDYIAFLFERGLR